MVDSKMLEYHAPPSQAREDHMQQVPPVLERPEVLSPLKHHCITNNRMKATWHKLAEAEILKRSSHVISVINDSVYIFGGELQPRQPRDNDVHVIQTDSAKDISLTTVSSTPGSPSPRVGSASTSLGGKLYLFSGRGGTAMTPIEENGSIWQFDPLSSSWTLLLPSVDLYPAARSYHCMASDKDDTLFVHAGCPEKGRLADLWEFSVSQRKWKQLTSAPEPARGGASIAFAGGALYRINGFDGKAEQGGTVDVYDPKSNYWTSQTYTPDGISGPAPRSVSALLPVSADGKSLLVTLFGERDPSSLGHQGAGRMLDDVWAYEIESKIWTKVKTNVGPEPRGWFAADVASSSTSEMQILVHGGLAENNERLGDTWTLVL